MNLKIYVLSFLLLCFTSCKKSSNAVTSSPQLKTETAIDTVFSSTTQSSNLQTEKNTEVKNVKKASVYKYVNAPSGLNFRDAPEGNVLGKFPDNLRLEILEVTDATSEIKDYGKTVTGNWVKVRVESAVGYVFDAFLKENYSELEYEAYMNELSVFALNMYYDKNNDYFPFISLTDEFYNLKFPKVQKEFEETMDKETHHDEYSFPVKGKDRTQFLNNRDINESDYLHLYNYKTEEFKKFILSELQLLSHESIYGGSYLTGLDLKGLLLDIKRFSYDDTFAYIGKENPFIIGKVKPIKWNRIDNSIVPKVELCYNNFFKSAEYEVDNAYHDTINNNDYYYANLRFPDSDYKGGTFLFVLSSNNQLLYQEEITSGESRQPTFYPHENYLEDGLPFHYTGQLFKNKPPVIFGLYSISFGCPFIDFLDPIEKSVYIQCDNRH